MKRSVGLRLRDQPIGYQTFILGVAVALSSQRLSRVGERVMVVETPRGVNGPGGMLR
jgi:predicted polyphosphate/ATP-dependent NAD kinase